MLMAHGLNRWIRSCPVQLFPNCGLLEVIIVNGAISSHYYGNAISMRRTDGINSIMSESTWLPLLDRNYFVA